MRPFALLLALLLALPAWAATIAVVRAEDGALLALTDELGPCLGGSRQAVWTSADGKERVPGCWRLSGAVVQVAFLDGDAVEVPVRLLRRPDNV
jgi:hypothetical protein